MGAFAPCPLHGWLRKCGRGFRRLWVHDLIHMQGPDSPGPGGATTPPTSAIQRERVNLGPRRAVLTDLYAEGAIAAPCYDARELPKGLHDQRDYFLMRHMIVDLDLGAARREVHHAAFEIPGWSLQLSTPEGSLARVSPALLGVSMCRFGFHRHIGRSLKLATLSVVRTHRRSLWGWSAGDVKRERPFSSGRLAYEWEAPDSDERMDLGPRRCLANEPVVYVNTLALRCHATDHARIGPAVVVE